MPPNAPTSIGSDSQAVTSIHWCNRAPVQKQSLATEPHCSYLVRCRWERVREEKEGGSQSPGLPRWWLPGAAACSQAGTAGVRGSPAIRQHNMARWQHDMARWQHNMARWQHDMARWQHDMARWQHNMARWQHNMAQGQNKGLKVVCLAWLQGI